jgi:hypothetical protein
MPEALEDRVLATLRDEASHGDVGEYLLLRCLGRPHEPSVLRPRQEILRKQLREVPVRGHLRARLRRPRQHPQESMPAAVQVVRYLVRLGRREAALATEAEEHHGAQRLS